MNITDYTACLLKSLLYLKVLFVWRKEYPSQHNMNTTFSIQSICCLLVCFVGFNESFNHGYDYVLCAFCSHPSTQVIKFAGQYTDIYFERGKRPIIWTAWMSFCALNCQLLTFIQVRRRHTEAATDLGYPLLSPIAGIGSSWPLQPWVQEQAGTEDE